MNRILFSSLCILILLLYSCNGNLEASEVQNRIQGKWYFSEVEFRDKGSLIKKDVSANWTNFAINFFYDGSLELIDLEQNDTLTGLWYVIEDTEYNSGTKSYTKVSKLDLYIYSDVYDVRYMRWEYLVINNEKFKAQEEADIGRYFYQLKR